MRGLGEIRAMNEKAQHSFEEREKLVLRKMAAVLVKVFEDELSSKGYRALQQAHPELQGVSEQEVTEFLSAGRKFSAVS